MNWRPVDVVAVILASAVFLSLVTPAVRSMVYGMPLTETAVALVADVLKVALGGIIAYIGYGMEK